MHDTKNFVLNTSIELIQVEVIHLQLGMYVSKLDRPWLETAFFFQGFMLKTKADIEEVQKRCNFVYVDIEKTKKNVVIKPRKIPFSKAWIEGRVAPEKKSSFKQEFVYAEAVHSKISHVVKSFIEDVHLGRPINVAIAKKVVSDTVESILNSPDALMWLTQLKNKDEYTSQHSMNVCILAIVLARHLNLPENKIQDIGLCGLMHDVGKMKIPLNVLNKPGRYVSEEREIMNSHTTLGWKEMISTGGMPKVVSDAVYSHHERLDGTGYPRGLSAELIHPYTRIISISDAYDAMTSDRVYKKGITHLEAINVMTKASGGQFDYSLVIKFIESLGIYPPGNIVEMTNGEVALVTEVNQLKKLKPKVTMLLDEDKKRVKPQLVDLAKIDLDSSNNTYAIKRIVRPEEYNFDLNHLYKIGIINSVLSDD